MATAIACIPDAFLPYVDAAVVRFSYLYPSVVVERSGPAVNLTDQSCDAVLMKQEFLHLLYREKIYAETLDLRKALFSGLT